MHWSSRSIRALGIFLISVLFFVLTLLFGPDAPSKPYYVNIQGPLVIAHQGGDRIWPGNTMYAFEKAVQIPSLFLPFAFQSIPSTQLDLQTKALVWVRRGTRDSRHK